MSLRQGDSMIVHLLQDLRISARSLAGRPGFTVLVLVTLALGIGANTAIFSVVDGVLLSPLPFEDEERLLRVYGRFDAESGFDFPEFPLSEPEFLDLREQAEALEAVGAYHFTTRAISGGEGDAQRIVAAGVTPGLFEVLGVAPARGRAFHEEEGRPGGANVVLLSHGLWQQRYGGDPTIVGREIRLDNALHRVVGVMPAGFDFPARARLWLPMVIDPADPGGRASHYFTAFAKLVDGVTLEAAGEELAGMMSGWAEAYPEIHTGHYLFYRPLREDLVGSARPALLTLLAASGLVLLLACANIAAVLAARGEERSREVAVRSALGARRGRLLTLLMSESLLLAAGGGLLGVLLARIGLDRLLDLQAAGVPRADAVALDARVLAAAAVATLLTALLFGLAPSLRVARQSPQLALREGGGGATSRGFGRSLLVAAEVALCFLLVLGAGLMVRSLDRLLRVDAGFEVENRMVAQVMLPASVYDEDSISLTFDRIAERMRALPGVVSVATSGGMPLLGDYGMWDFRIEGRPEPGPGEQAWNGAFDIVSPEYFRTAGIELLRGRGIAPEDRRDSEPVVVINQAFADRYFSGEDPLGRRIAVSGDGWEPMRIVGIVENARYRALDQDSYPRYYGAAAQWTSANSSPPRSRFLTIRTEGTAELEAPMRAALREIDPDLPLYRLQSLEEAVRSSVARPRFTSILLTIFAAVALALGASGTYGVLAYAVARKSRELGIRKALGASPAALVSLVVRQGMVPVVAGLAIGAFAAFWLSRLLASQLYGITATDAATWAGVVAVLGAVALFACLVPALRAFRLDPVEALRSD